MVHNPLLSPKPQVPGIRAPAPVKSWQLPTLSWRALQYPGNATILWNLCHFSSNFSCLSSKNWNLFENKVTSKVNTFEFFLCPATCDHLIGSLIDSRLALLLLFPFQAYKI